MSKVPYSASVRLSRGSISKSESLKREIALNKNRMGKHLRPNSLEDFPLEIGVNKVEFVCQDASIEARLFLWKKNAKMVVCDVDGTITKSDVRGNLYPMFGKDWTQPGIATLLSKIEEHGYFVIYVTARSLAQQATTRSFIESIEQDAAKMPRGPILMSPDGLISSFKREVIDKSTQKLKIAILNEVAELFDELPFAGGLGNRENVEI